MSIRRICLLIFLLVPVSGTACSRSMTASETPVSTREKYMMSDSTDTEWHLWWQAGRTVLRGYSEGYVLSTNKPETDSVYYSNPEKAKYIGSANGAVLEPIEFYSFGMQNPTTRATAKITLPDGQDYKCEIYWHSFTKDHLKKI